MAVFYHNWLWAIAPSSIAPVSPRRARYRPEDGGRAPTAGGAKKRQCSAAGQFCPRLAGQIAVPFAAATAHSNLGVDPPSKT
jgi:hypothetical protein